MQIKKFIELINSVTIGSDNKGAIFFVDGDQTIATNKKGAVYMQTVYSTASLFGESFDTKFVFCFNEIKAVTQKLKHLTEDVQATFDGIDVDFNGFEIVESSTFLQESPKIKIPIINSNPNIIAGQVGRLAHDTRYDIDGTIVELKDATSLINFLSMFKTQDLEDKVINVTLTSVTNGIHLECERVEWVIPCECPTFPKFKLAKTDMDAIINAPLTLNIGDSAVVVEQGNRKIYIPIMGEKETQTVAVAEGADRLDDDFFNSDIW